MKAKEHSRQVMEKVVKFKAGLDYKTLFQGLDAINLTFVEE